MGAMMSWEGPHEGGQERQGEEEEEGEVAEEEEQEEEEEEEEATWTFEELRANFKKARREARQRENELGWKLEAAAADAAAQLAARQAAEAAAEAAARQAAGAAADAAAQLAGRQAAEAAAEAAYAKLAREQQSVMDGTSDWLKLTPRALAKKAQQRMPPRDSESCVSISTVEGACAAVQVPRPVKAWSHFGALAVEYANGLNDSEPVIDQTECGFAGRAERPPEALEVANSAALTANFCLANAVLEASKSSQKYGLAEPGSLAQFDAALYGGRPADGVLHAVAEIKRSALLEMIADLIAALGDSDGHNPKVARMVRQILGYMVRCKVGLGILTSYNKTFFLRWVPPGTAGRRRRGHLEVANPVGIDDAEPTAIAAFSYFASVAAAWHREGVPPPTEADIPVKLSEQQPTAAGELPRAVVQPLPPAAGAGEPPPASGGSGSESAAALLNRLRWLRLADVGLDLPGTELPAIVGTGMEGTVLRGSVGGHPAAVKEFDGCSGAAVQRFANELAVYEACAPLQGRAIPRLLAHGIMRLTETPALALSLEGRSLAECRGPLAEPLAAAARAALASLHEAGVLHGDVRLEHFFMAASDANAHPPGTPRVLLADFGLSQLGASPAACEAEAAEFDIALRAAAAAAAPKQA